ncbi:MAG: hypothetical protein Q4G64_10815, partial [bacterium]|nr:hypothetical protein [bacterium]
MWSRRVLAGVVGAVVLGTGACTTETPAPPPEPAPTQQNTTDQPGGIDLAPTDLPTLETTGGQSAENWLRVNGEAVGEGLASECYESAGQYSFAIEGPAA